ncbi:hypothetical protein [Streptomyces sp. NPDC047718]|uniref:hypothetical protein n=1 Tax=Streptomyces sp. NPDC047718 TaxID=3155479 RepID=UPI0033F6D936
MPGELFGAWRTARAFLPLPRRSATPLFGNANSIPGTGDWDHTGLTNIGVSMPGNRTFYFRHDAGSVTSTTYGSAGDTPVVGGWDGNGYATQGVVHS